MTAKYALYSSVQETLPADNMQGLTDVAPWVETTETGTTYFYRWPRLQVMVSELPHAQLGAHLQGFERYVRSRIYHGEVPIKGQRIIDEIRGVRLMVSVQVEPGLDTGGRAKELISRLCGGLKPMMFFEDAIYDMNGERLAGLDPL